MIPRKQDDEIKKIVSAFKFNMMPEYKEGESRDTLNHPYLILNTYGKENTYLNRVSECF